MQWLGRRIRYCWIMAMVTVGRRPNTDDMGLGTSRRRSRERGLITVDKQGRTNVPNNLCHN